MGTQGGATLTGGDHRTKQGYLLGASESERARLDAQSATLAMPTELFLQRAGIASGMRVLDLGTGLGDVAFQVSYLVGPGGAVVGIDESPAMLAIAEQRRVAAGLGNVWFVDADAQTFRRREAFDAVVGRLIWCYLPDPVEVVRHHVGGFSHNGVMLMIDQDVGSVRSEPPLPLLDAALYWGVEVHRRAGADPMIGARLGLILRDAGLTEIEAFGIQEYVSPDDPEGPVLVSGIVHTPGAGRRRRRESRPRMSWVSTRSTNGSLNRSSQAAPSSCRPQSRAPGAGDACGPSVERFALVAFRPLCQFWSIRFGQSWSGGRSAPT